jgi:hypothetical protein
VLGEVRIGNRHRGDEGIYVGRGTPLGNKFTAEKYGREKAIQLYREWLLEQMRVLSAPARALQQLAFRVANGEDLVLVCSCAPKACHAEVIREMALKIARAISYGDVSGPEAEEVGTDDARDEDDSTPT